MQEITPSYLEWLMLPFNKYSPKMVECRSCKRTLDISQFISLVNGTQTKCCFDCKEERRVAQSMSEVRLTYLELRRTMPPCTLCGDSDVNHLEYDHVDPEDKRSELNRMTTVAELMSELKKCRSLCKKCHRRITYARERESMIGRSTKTLELRRVLVESKHQLVNSLKLQLGKCSVETCPQIVTMDDITFFEFDHIDPFSKIAGIGYMVVGGYSNESIASEIKKCQLLCGYCHKDKTAKDRALKIEYYKSLKSPLPKKEKQVRSLTMADATAIRRLYNEGSLYQREIADLYNVDVQTVSRLILNKNHTDASYVRTRFDTKTPSKTIDDKIEAVIVSVLKSSSKPSIAAIAKEYGCHRRKIEEIADKNGISLESIKFKDVDPATVQYIFQAHVNGVTNATLMKQFKLTGRRVKKILETGSGRVRDRDTTERRDASIKADYSTGQVTRNQLAKKYGVSVNTIDRALK